MSVTTAEQTKTVRWNSSVGADGYAIYRKTDNKWVCVGKTDGCEYVDASAADGSECTYTVVPYTQDNGDFYYGNFSYTGYS